MRCSNCSHEVKPIVCVDIDGTLGDYHGHFLRFAAAWLTDEDTALTYLLDMSHQMYDGSIPFSQYCMEMLEIDLTTYRQIKLAYRQGGMKRTMPMFQYASAICREIQYAGAELWITTTRPYLSLDNIVPDTVEWCRRHRITYEGILFDELKYEEFAKRVDTERVVAVLDDLPEMYDAAANVMHHGHDVPILVAGKYNTGVRRTIMADLIAARDIVMARIEMWKERHA